MNFQVNTDYAMLGAMLSPALFMTATGSLLLSANNRLARVVDRLRTLLTQSDELAQGIKEVDHLEEHRAHVDHMLNLQQRRAGIILTVVTLLYLAFSCFVGTSLTVGLNYLSHHIYPVIPTSLALIGVSLLLAACMGMLREARLGVRTLRRDLAFHEGINRLARSKPP